MKVVCCIPARLTSSRLPRKVFLEINGKPIIQHVIERCGKATRINKIVVATTINKEDDELYNFLHDKFYDVGVYRGDPKNIVSRLVRIAELEKADIIINCDCEQPLADHRLIDKTIEVIELGYPFAYIGGVPRGMTVYAFAVDYLKQIATTKDCNTDEHWYKLFEIEDGTCIDTEEDYQILKGLMEEK